MTAMSTSWKHRSSRLDRVRQRRVAVHGDRVRVDKRFVIPAKGRAERKHNIRERDAKNPTEHLS